MFLVNDLKATNECWPPEIVVWKGRHRVVCMKHDIKSGRQLPLVEEKYEDEDDNLFRNYLLHDNPLLAEPVSGLPTMGRS